jgi:integrase
VLRVPDPEPPSRRELDSTAVLLPDPSHLSRTASVERLISDTRILEDRRVFYAFKGLADLRHGEAAGLCWRNYDPSLEPLGSLSLHRTKTQVPRRIPVHPTLARVLAEWKLAGFERTLAERQPRTT